MTTDSEGADIVERLRRPLPYHHDHEHTNAQRSEAADEILTLRARAEAAERERDKAKGDLSVVRLQLARIDETLIGFYGEIATAPQKELRRILDNIVYVLIPRARLSATDGGEK